MLIDSYRYGVVDDSFLIIGDSNSGDSLTASTIFGPATPTGVAMKWTGSGLLDCATGDFNNSAGTHGTPWKQFVLNRYNRLGRRTCIISHASSGSEFYPNGDNNNWYTSGTLYAAMLADVPNALAFIKKPQLTGIFVWCGVNDFTSANTLADCQTGINSLFTRLMADFPNVPIYFVSTGMDGTTQATTARKMGFKSTFRSLADTYPVLTCPVNLDQYWFFNYQNGVHLTQPGYNKVGEMFERAFSNTETNKQVKQVLSAFHDELDAADKAAWKTFIESCQSNDMWTDKFIDNLQIYVARTRLNVGFEATNLFANVDNSFDWVMDSHIETNPTGSKYLNSGYIPSISQRLSTETDYVLGVATKTNLTTAGTAGFLYDISGSSRRLIQSVTPNVTFQANDATNRVIPSITAIPSNSRLTQRRIGTVPDFLINGSVVYTGSGAAGAASTAVLTIGGSTNRINCQFKYLYTGKATKADNVTPVDIAMFEGFLSTLITALETP